MVEGVAALVVATTMLAAMFIGLYVFVFHAGAVGSVAARTARSLGLLPPAPVVPMNRAIEPIARDLRRLHLAVRNQPPGRSMARHSGVLGAYDDILLEACRALGVPDTLSDLPAGTERDAERLRVEYLLEEAGLRLRPAA